MKGDRARRPWERGMEVDVKVEVEKMITVDVGWSIRCGVLADLGFGGEGAFAGAQCLRCQSLGFLAGERTGWISFT